jgi:hypothetical protein
MEIEKRYLNVPVALLRGFVTNPKTTIRYILVYCVYKSIAIDREYGSVEEMEIEFETDFEGFGLCQKSIADLGEPLYDSLAQREKPYVGIHIDRLILFYAYDSDEFDRVVFVAYVALKSILQNQAYKSVTVEYLFSRMDGYAMIVPIADISPEIWKWSTRKRRANIFDFLESHFQLIRPLGNTKGIVFSFLTQKLKDGSKMTREKLEFNIQTKKMNYRKKIIEEEKRKAHDKVKYMLEKGRS